MSGSFFVDYSVEYLECIFIKSTFNPHFLNNETQKPQSCQISKALQQPLRD